jgi:DNA replication protein DnaC
MRRSGIPDRYQDATWDLVANPADYAEWKTPIILQAKIDHGRGLILPGPVGTGKSSAAACIAREVLKLPRRGSVRWEYFPSMLDELETREGRIRVQQRQAGLVVWDDVGVDKLAEWHFGFIDRIVERRYSMHQSMLITTNMDPADIAADKAWARTWSRWRQTTEPIWITGQDRRRPE